MNLNQAAHGDREFGFIAARLRLERKVVVGHWGDAAVQEEIGTWTRAACAKADWQGGKIARFGDNMREVAVTDGDKVEAQRRLGFSINTWGVGDLVKVVNEASDADVDVLVAQYLDEYDVAAELRPGGDRAREPARRRPHRARPAPVPRRRRLHRLHRHLRGPARPQAAPRPRRPAPDGRRLRLRRGRGLEDLRDGPRHEGHVGRARPAARRSWRTTPTTSRATTT